MQARRHLMLLAPALVLVTALLVLSGWAGTRAPTAAAASTSAVYSLVGTATMTGVSSSLILCNPDADIQLCPAYASAAATCTKCQAGAPDTSAMSLALQQITTAPSDSCSAQKASGVMSMTWPDSSVSSASVSGRFYDDKQNLTLAGTFFPSTSIFAGDTVSLALVGLPPSPCLAATYPITATLSIDPPSPI